LINALGAVATAGALAVIFVAKFVEGAWVTLLVVPPVMGAFLLVRGHYERLQKELDPPLEADGLNVRPLKVVIPVESWNRPADQALHLALRITDDVTIAHVTIQEPDEDAVTKWHEKVQEPLRAAGMPEPKVEFIRSPYRRLVEPFLKYIQAKQKENPDRQVAVVVPEIVDPRWWDYLLHNHAARALRERLLADCKGDIVVIDAPWHPRH
jgi:hypothetical protein